jgi:uncharacterized phage protein gp47/JayE
MLPESTDCLPRADIPDESMVIVTAADEGLAVTQVCDACDAGLMPDQTSNLLARLQGPHNERRVQITSTGNKHLVGKE